MRIGLIDADAVARGKVTYPNLALMKISAWHKAQGDTVEWYKSMTEYEYDRVYVSKVFSDEYSKDYPYPIKAKEIIRGGAAMPFRSARAAERSTIRARISLCRVRSNISIPIIVCTNLIMR